jgi:hypothetical protein
VEHITLAAAEVPLPPGVGEAAQRIANEGVLGALLILALGIACVLLWLLLRARAEHERILKEVREDYERHRDELVKQIEALHDRRFSDIQQVMTALNSNTGALNVISQTAADRAASAKEMGEALRELLLIAKQNGESLRLVSACVQANGSAIDKLLWHGGAVRSPGSAGGA